MLGLTGIYMSIYIIPRVIMLSGHRIQEEALVVVLQA